jgi:outer membrane immunogenic protein
LKKVTIAIAAIAALMVEPALSADMAVKALAPASPSWSGFYLGASVGGRWMDTTADELSVTINGTPQHCPAGVPCVLSDQLNGSTVRLGGYLGYNWQVSPTWLVGLEGDIAWARQTTTHFGMGLPGTINGFLFAGPGNPPNGPADSFSVATRWDASARARVGFLVTPSALLYVTGGAAWLNFSSTSSCALAPAGSCATTVAPLSITNSTTRVGWTIGGGGEMRLSSNWFLRTEYRYADFGTAAYTNTTVNTLGGNAFVYLDTYDVHIRTHTGLVGIAYKFN